MKKLIALIQTILFKHKYLHFFLTGTSGVALNLFVTWFLTTFYFGLAGYFKAYIIALAVNLIYNFALHTKITFKTKEGHARRFLLFVSYSLAMTAVQAFIVRTTTPMIGLEYYLFVIAGTILVFSIVTFLFFKFFLFRESSNGSLNDTSSENMTTTRGIAFWETTKQEAGEPRKEESANVPPEHI